MIPPSLILVSLGVVTCGAWAGLAARTEPGLCCPNNTAAWAKMKVALNVAGPFSALPAPLWAGAHVERVPRGGHGLCGLCLRGHLLLEVVAS